MRGPFNSLIRFSSLLNDEIKDDNYKNVPLYTKQLLNTSNKAFELVENLLNWSRTQIDQIVVHPSSILLINIVNDTLDIMLPKVDDKQITITVNIDSKIKVFTDPDVLTVILRNLLSNAIKFTFKGGKIEIGTIEEKDYCVVFVKDNGKGIGHESIDSIFTKNKGYTSSGTENETGSGLGLYIAADFIKKLGGKIWVESELEKGSTFSFSIPKKQG
ncbi:MAG TPA: HAMP domain-containing sensor histidine kinase [Bacteroidales bacterium]|nr:HAMP domain-containing sensor histidine kinase [Bacteroidales bacterium]